MIYVLYLVVLFMFVGSFSSFIEESYYWATAQLVEGVGILLNAIVVTANHGKMPIFDDASSIRLPAWVTIVLFPLRIIPLILEPKNMHVAAGPQVRCGWLADRIAVGEISYSIGDLMITVGLIMAILLPFWLIIRTFG
jgi:hypothetical protein